MSMTDDSKDDFSAAKALYTCNPAYLLPRLVTMNDCEQKQVYPEVIARISMPARGVNIESSFSAEVKSEMVTDFSSTPKLNRSSWLLCCIFGKRGYDIMIMLCAITCDNQISG